MPHIRISDHWNAVAPGGGTDPATVIDIPFPVERSLHGDCQHGDRQHLRDHHHGERGGAGVQSRTLSGRSLRSASYRSLDGGTDGFAATTPNTLFEVQGIFIP